MTDEPKNPLRPDADLHPVDDLEAIDVPDAPEHFDELVDADEEKPVEALESAELPQIPGEEKPDAEATEEVVDADSRFAGTSEVEPVSPEILEEISGETPGVEERRPVRDIYEVTGRARPQWIVPKTVAAESGAGSASDPGVESAAPVVEPESDETSTTVFSAGGLGASGAGLGASEASAAAGASGASELSDTPVEDTTTQVFNPRRVSTDAPVGTVAGDGYFQAEETEFLSGPLAGDAQFSGAMGASEGVFASDAVPQGSAPDPALGTTAETAMVPTAPRGTLDLGLLLLRILVGVPLILRGLQTLFSFGGDPGIDALEARFGDFIAGDILAIALPTAEVVGGGLLLLGLATPIGGAVSLVAAGFMALFELSLSDVGYWPYQLSQSAQSWAFLGLLGLVLIVTGPGRYSADISRGWATRPRASAWLWTIIGVAAMAALWLLAGGGNPF